MSGLRPEDFFYDPPEFSDRLQSLVARARGRRVLHKPGFKELMFDALELDLASGVVRYRQAQAAAEAESLAAEQAAAAQQAKQLYLGTAGRPAHWAQVAHLVGEDRGMALSLDGGHVILASGTIGSGKSQSLLTLIDSSLRPRPPLTSATLAPTAAIVLHTDLSGVNLPELVFAAAPNARPADLEILRRSGVGPAGLPRIRLVCHEDEIPQKIAALERDFAAYPGALPVEVFPLRLSLGQLGMRGIEALLGVPPNRVPEYLQALTACVKRLGPDLTCAALLEQLDCVRHIDRKARARISARLALLAGLEDRRADLWSLVEPGALTIFDLSGRWLRRQDVFPLVAALLNILCERSPRHGALQRLIAFDEVNRLARDPILWEHLVMVARQARHQGLTLWFSGQDLLTVPDELLGVATQVLCFRAVNPVVFGDIKRRVAAYARTSYHQAAVLLPGQALWASAVASDPALCGAVHLVQFRPPACAHGGHTRVVF